MTCAELEILLADYLEGTLHGQQKSAVETHLAGCMACAELARDAAGAASFMERAAGVEAPPELVTRILFEITRGPSRAFVKPHWGRRLFGKWLEPVLQPRFAMGVAMTVLSFTMLGRQWKLSELDPVKVWMTAEDHAHRTWERGVKYYESMRLVFEIQTRLEELAEESNAPPAPTDVETR